jgi:hypothetical protein
LDRWKRILSKRDLSKRQARNAHAKKHGLRRGGEWWDVFDPNKNGVSQAFNDVGDKIVSAANTVGDAVVSAANTVGDAVVSGVKTVSAEFERWGQEINKAFNEVGNFFNNLPNVLKDAFAPDGPLARTFDPNKNGVADGMRRLGEEAKRSLENAFDPEKNGVGASMRKFGNDLEKGFEDIGNKLKDTFSKESMDRAFGPFVAAMNSFGDSCNQYFSDPSNIVGFLSICLSAVGSICPPPISNALSVLAACTEMIGNAILGKPFDPMSLVDLASAFIVPPASKLAKNIATTTAKATTILGKARATAGAIQKTAVQAVKESAKNISEMSAASKAILVGKTVFQVTGKIAGGVVGQSNPVDSQRTGEQVQHDEVVAEEFVEDQNSDVRKDNAAAMDAELTQEEYDKALREARDAGTVAGDYKGKTNQELDDLTEEKTRNETEPGMKEMTDRATEKPRSYVKDEKIFFYRNATKEERDAEIEQAANDAVAAKQAQEEAKRVKLEAEGTKKARDEARAIERQQMKNDNEVRKYGFTYQEALGRLMMYKEEQDKFAKATGVASEPDIHPPTKTVVEKGGRKKRRGGIYEGDTSLAEFMLTDDINVGDPKDFGGAPYLPPIRTPTFFHFVKEKFTPVPDLKDPENWWKDYNNFITGYNKQKADYNKLLQANQVAIAERNKMPMAQKDKAYQAWLSSDFLKKDPTEKAKMIMEQGGKAQLKDYIESLGFTVETWNSLMKSEKQEDLFLDGGPKTTVDTNVQAPQLIKPLSRPFELPEALEDDPILHERQGGIVTSIPTPKKEDILAYYKSKAIQKDPRAIPDELALMKAWESDWSVDPAQTASAIRAYMASFTGKGKRRRSISDFFKLRRGGAEEEFNWDTFDPAAPVEPPKQVDAAGEEFSWDDFDPSAPTATSQQSEGSMTKIRNQIEQDAHEEQAVELWSDRLPQALQEYTSAMPEFKRPKRAKVQALREWGVKQFGAVEDMTDDLSYSDLAKEFESTLETEAPELNDRGLDEQTPKDAFYTDHEGEVETLRQSTALKEKQDQEEAQKAEEENTKAFQDLDSKEVAEYNRLREEFKKAFDAAKDEDGRTKAINDFNENYPVGDARRMSGSGRPQPSLVMRNLWLGNAHDALNKAWLKKHKIMTVFNMTKDQPFTDLNIKKVRFAIDDHHSNVDLMTKMGPEWASQVFEAIAEGPVLLHCVEGRQRSPTLTALVMGIQRPRKLKTLVKALKAKRPLVFNPSPTFARSLKTWVA